MATIAEDVVLITHTNVDSGVFAEPDELTDVLAGGCLIAEALLAGLLRLDDGRRFGTGPTAISADADPLVERAAQHALATTPTPETQHDDERWLAEVTYPLGAGGEIVGRLRGRGAIRSEERKKFGRKAAMVDVTDPTTLAGVHDRMRAVMVDGATPDPTTSLLILLTLACGGHVELGRAERKQWDQRAEALYTWTYWQGDEGRPSEPTPGVDDDTRRMIGDFVVSLGTAYQMGIANEILTALNRSR